MHDTNEVSSVEPTRFQKLKTWTSDHAPDIVAFTAFAAGVVGVFALSAHSQKEANKRIDAYNDWADKENEWLEDQANENKDVYWLGDKYLVIDRDTPREVRIPDRY